MHNNFDWSERNINRLRDLWAEGHSCSEIGRRMGVSANAIVGKSHRLGLPSRPSPIRRDPNAPRRVKPTPLVELQAPVAATAAPPREAAPQAAQVIERLPLMPPRPKPIKSCEFPLWDGKGPPNGLVCEAPSLPGKPYCAEHCAICYQPAPKRLNERAFA